MEERERGRQGCFPKGASEEKGRTFKCLPPPTRKCIYFKNETVFHLLESGSVREIETAKVVSSVMVRD